MFYASISGYQSKKSYMREYVRSLNKVSLMRKKLYKISHYPFPPLASFFP